WSVGRRSRERTRRGIPLSRPGRRGRDHGRGVQRSLDERGPPRVRPRSGIRGGLPGVADAMGGRRIRGRPAWDLGPRRPGERLKPTPVFHTAMTEKRLFALVALLIGLVAGLLILVDAVNAIQLSSVGSMNCDKTRPRIKKAKGMDTPRTIRSRWSVERPVRTRESEASIPSLKM